MTGIKTKWFGVTYAAADKVDLLATVDPNIKPATVGHKQTCWTETKG